MVNIKVFGTLCLAFVVAKCSNITLERQECEASLYIRDLNTERDRRKNIGTAAEWAYSTNITDFNENAKAEVLAENAEYFKEKAIELRQYDYDSFKDDDLKRQFKKLAELGYNALPDAEYRELLSAISTMDSNFATVKVCSYNNRTKCDLSLDPDIEEIIATSRDPEELKYYWLEWYNKAGTPVRDAFDKYVELKNKAAILNNFTSGAESWLDRYDDDSFEQQLETIFDEIRPLHEQLHAYVRYRLRLYYGNSIVPEKGPIPMHLLGNLWAQSWINIAGIVTPYPDKQLIDVTAEMVKQGYTPLQMFQMGDDFFQSLNMTKLPQTFWDKSILVNPNDGRVLDCQPSAWDFFLTDDVRILQCTRVAMQQLSILHHELGHIQYFLQYQDQPSVYREGANPGFHEAVGDVIALSVSTPKHFTKIGLLNDFVLDEETRINQLFFKALSKIVFPPFAFTVDKYRWAIFRGQIDPKDYNCAFWKLREQYSGIEPPVERSEADFDPPAKYHISADVEYARYAVSYIIQFLFYKIACEKAGQYVSGNSELALDNCDIYQSPDAGNAFKAMLAMGSSKPWPDAMEVFTGERNMSVGALLEYFQPLATWLEEYNKKNNVHVGWESSNKCVKNSTNA